MRHVLLLALLAAPLAAQDAAPAGSLPGTAPGEEDVRLADGALLRGRVLKETEDNLYVDVGFTVLQVPRGSVVGRSPAGGTVGGAGGEVRLSLIHI